MAGSLNAVAEDDSESYSDEDESESCSDEEGDEDV